MEEEKAQGGLIALLHYQVEVCRGEGDKLILEVHRDRTRGKGHNRKRESPIRHEHFFIFLPIWLLGTT